jgi:molybdopterin-biosynthesis enzyme MoeA-like protein
VADFCFNVANLQQRLPRARLVALLLGGLGPTSRPVARLRAAADAETARAAAALDQAKREVAQSHALDHRSGRAEAACQRRWAAALKESEAVGGGPLASREPAGAVSPLEEEIRDSPEDAAR